MSLNWGGGMAEQRITKANDEAALAWLKRQDAEIEREREEKGAGWYMLLDVVLCIVGWSIVGGIGYGLAKLIAWVIR